MSVSPANAGKAKRSAGAAARDVTRLTSSVKLKIESSIIGYAVDVYLKRQHGNLDLGGEEDLGSDVDSDWEMGFFPECDNRGAESNVGNIVQLEFDKYMTSVVTRTEQKDLLQFWSTKMVDYPNLSIVAAAIFGVPSSAAGIEVDFGETRRMITTERTNLSGTTIEMCQVVLRNRSLIDLGQIREIPSAELESYYPISPNVPGLDSNDPIDDDDEDEHELSAMVETLRL